jgi:L-ascorbate metabolism protein UlaG (beta-lactamase superfamily)
MDFSKKIFVFSSHHHMDHFNIEIFQILKNFNSVSYIFSKDIYKKYNQKFFTSHGVSPEIYGKITFLPENSSTQKEGLFIETLHSTDEGVAFIVQIEGHTIYHSGDLNYWVWDDESEDANNKMIHDYKNEINKIKGRHFDLAFLVLDPRQEENFLLGFDYFMRNTQTEAVIPMHFWVIHRLLINFLKQKFALIVIKY